MTSASHRLVSATAAVALCSSLGARASAQPAAQSSAAPLAVEVMAPPAPDPPPEQLKQAEATVKAAELTPIVPDPHQATRTAFQLYAEIDLPVLTVGLVFVGARFVRTQRAFCAPLCDRNDLNSIDRTTAGYWNPGWGMASNAGLLALGLGAGALFTADEGPLGALNDGVVIAESALSATAAATVMTLAAGRPRPFLYGTKASLTDRNGTDAGNSFLSSHASVAFAIATSTFMAERRLHPRSAIPYWILGAGLGASAFVATSRVLAGMHFITDAAGGALVGSATGILVASLHSLPVTLVPLVGETQRGLGIQGSF
jgi:membrane-associated phospholipid phosphatase